MILERESFVCYASWLSTARKIYKDRDDLARFCLGLMELGLFGIVPEDDDSPERVAYEIARKQIEANNKKYLNGKKGGAPEGNQNAGKQPKNNQKTTKGQPKNKQKATEKQPNDNVNDNENVNVNDEEEEKPPSSGISIMLSDGNFYTVSTEKIAEYRKVFNHVDVDYQLKAIALVAKNQPDKRRPEARIDQFILNWLIKAEEQAVRDEKAAGKPQGRKNEFHNFQQHDYDFAAIEKALFDHDRDEMKRG